MTDLGLAKESGFAGRKEMTRDDRRGHVAECRLHGCEARASFADIAGNDSQRRVEVRLGATELAGSPFLWALDRAGDWGIRCGRLRHGLVQSDVRAGNAA